ncbi:MAG: hypothetical protein HY246_24355, partial [Proteobacteria bacterium]|nr:hypothetical protein [Pseudomonadota bacterium]
LRDVLDLIDALAAHRLTPDGFQAKIMAVFQRVGLQRELASWIDRAFAEKADQVLYRRTLPQHRQTLQLLYVHPHEVHPPHCHHNLISTQMVLAGKLAGREFDRVARLSPDTLLLKLATDRAFGPGDTMETTEVKRNAHWFAAGDAPCVMLNFYILGYQEWTFDRADGRPQGRRLLDPTVGVQGDGLIVAKEIDMAKGYAKFGPAPLAAFPMPGIN